MNEKLIHGEGPSIIDRVIAFCLQNRLVVLLSVAFIAGWGVIVAPFDWDIDFLPRNPVAVDAIPDTGENQQIVFTDWPGRSPQDVEDQITYPLTVSLLGVPGVRTIRSTSMFGFSSIFIIFEEDIEFYWSRSRILEKLNSLPEGVLPAGVNPALGPDATALGQIFWYTLEGRDPDGNPAGGWDLHELRSIQDWFVRYGLQSAEGVSEVASIGGFVQEYQIDVDPDAMRAYGVTLNDVFGAVRNSNLDVGARTIEVNNVEYIIRGLGFIESLDDLRFTVVTVNDNVPIYIKDVATVQFGPALRRGVLDKGGAEAVGGVVVARFGSNPMAVIQNVKEKIEELAPGLATKAVVDFSRVSSADVTRFAEREGFDAFDGGVLNQTGWMAWLRAVPRDDWPGWITTSQVTIVPFYDRTGLILETLGTLNEAILLQILVTVIVVLVMVGNLRTSVLISAILPMSVLMCFIAMKQFNVDANIVALSGIAIAIGTMVDMGIILCENIVRHLDEAEEGENRFAIVYRASSEVGSAVLTAVLTTVVGFLPVFTMIGAEGKLFKPLAFTKTFAILAAVLLALTIIPTLAYLLLATRFSSITMKRAVMAALIPIGIAVGVVWSGWAGLAVVTVAVYHLLEGFMPAIARRWAGRCANAAAIVIVAVVLAHLWQPFGPQMGLIRNLGFVAVVIGGLLLLFHLFMLAYPAMLRWCLDHKLLYMTAPLLLLVLGASVWLGFGRVFSFMPEPVKQTGVWSQMYHTFPGLGREFMPPLDEGSYLYMPTTMPHAGIGESLDYLQFQDRAIASIPEVDSVVGKIGRVESPLDPAPISMVETVVNYKPEYMSDESGHRLAFKYDDTTGEFIRDENGELIPDRRGMPYRQWRDHIRKPDDIWDEIVAAAQLPGATSAPRLQPIEARRVMLQSGMRAPMGVKVKGPDLETIEQVGLEIEDMLKTVPGVSPPTVFADRIVGKPYLEIDIDRRAIARFGLTIMDVQQVIQTAIGGEQITTTVEGRERYPVRVRYKRELRDQIETLGRILVPTPAGPSIPLDDLARIDYVRGPQMIRSEDTFLTAYVLFDKEPGHAEVEVVEACRARLQDAQARGEWVLPAGVSYAFAGAYENQVRAQKTLSVVLPLALFVIFMLLYLQFRAVSTTLLVFVGIAVAWAGGFCFIWLYGQPWFLDFTVAGVHMRDLFQIHPINLSVAIWVGFLALFGIATDDGVVIATYLEQSFKKRKPESVKAIRNAVVAAGCRRIRPCLMTTATTALALLPVLTSAGRGADVMIPMAIPSFGGMTVALLTLFQVPVLYCLLAEMRLRVAAVSETPRPTQPEGV